jgi:hypothetical protein
MKRYLLLLLPLLFAIGTMAPKRAAACDRAMLTYDSLVVSGTGYLLYVTLCVGAGRNGIEKGEEQNTGVFEFGFFDATPADPLVITTVTPSTVTPGLYPFTSTYATTGAACPPAVNPFGLDCRVRYSPTTAGRWFTCIDDITNCGDTTTLCFQFSFQMDQIPDSLRAYGVEGANIATNGCFPNSDMGLDLSTLPVVWGSFIGTGDESGVTLNWITYNDVSGSHYVVSRSNDGTQYSSIGSVAGKSLDKNDVAPYAFFDPNPMPGINYYKLTQMNDAGAISTSEIVQVVYNTPSSSQWNFVSPVPSQDFVNISFRSPTDQNYKLQVVNMKGEIVHTAEVEARIGSTDITLDLSNWAAGFYFIRLTGGDNSILEKKIVKM